MHKPFGLIRTRYMKENKGNRLTLTEIKQVELGILDYIVDICNKYNLIYYLSYGTLIGAIRHKGFIPWDDDIDISMPRDDYEKFLKITSSGQINSKYKCLVPLVDGYYYEFAKVIDTSTIVEEVSVQSTENGVWVDIFPLDGLNKSDKISHLSLMILNRCRAASVNNHFPHKTSGVLLPIEYVFWKVCRLIGFKAFLKKSLKLSRKYKYSDSKYVGYASSYPAYNKYLLKEWFDKTVLVEFEGRKYAAPVQYDEYLKMQYGNYMQLPPKEKRISHDMHAYWVGNVTK